MTLYIKYENGNKLLIENVISFTFDDGKCFIEKEWNNGGWSVYGSDKCHIIKISVL